MHKLMLFLVVSGLLLTAGCKSGGQREGGVNSKALVEDLNILLVVLDTVASEHVAVYGGEKAHTPFIDRLASQGVRFEWGHSVSSWTKPAVASLFTSLMPQAHKVERLPHVLPDQFDTMAEILKARGYSTVGVISHELIDTKYGFHQGFDSYVQTNIGRVNFNITSDKVSDRAINWLKNHIEVEEQNPFFMFLHYFDPHFNFHNHEQFDFAGDYEGPLSPGMDIRRVRRMLSELTEEDVEYLKNLHRSEVAFTDHHLGRVFDFLDEQKIAEKTMIILVADHGEEFMRHGWIGHTRTLFDELIRVPYIIALPGTFEPQVVDDPVSLIDLLPTVMAMLGEEPRVDWEGVSLVPHLTGKGERPAARDLFAEVSFRSSNKAKEVDKIAIMEGTLKLVYDEQKDFYKLFDRANDPEELDDLAERKPAEVERLAAKLHAWKASYSEREEDVEVESRIIDEEEMRKLESLGYM